MAAFKVVKELKEDGQPVSIPRKDNLQAKHQIYNGEELSSVRGVISKNLYIAKLHPITGESQTPIVNYGDSIEKYYENKRKV